MIHHNFARSWRALDNLQSSVYWPCLVLCSYSICMKNYRARDLIAPSGSARRDQVHNIKYKVNRQHDNDLSRRRVRDKGKLIVRINIMA